MPNMDMPIDYHVWDVTLEHYQRHMASWQTSCRTKSPFCHQYRMICFMRSLIWQLYNFATDFNRVLPQQAGNDIVNTLFK